MRIRSSLGLCFFVLSSLAIAQDSIIVTIDVPGAVWTLPASINAAGAIAGSYRDDAAIRGFLRDRYGNFTSFDAPGGQTLIEPKNINPAGIITGNYYGGSSPHSQGFLRAPDGTFTTFDVPVARQGTFPISINQTGTITGYYIDDHRRDHGFLRGPAESSRRSTLRAGATVPSPRASTSRGQSRDPIRTSPML